jgi:hypothetical protein
MSKHLGNDAQLLYVHDPILYFTYVALRTAGLFHGQMHDQLLFDPIGMHDAVFRSTSLTSEGVMHTTRIL